MRVATWNLEWAKPGSPRHRAALDHVASSEHFTATTVDPWPNVIDDWRISGHSGVAVDYEV